MKFKHLTIELGDYGTATIEELKKNQRFSILRSSVSMEASIRHVRQYVVNTKGDLINVGDFVKYCVPSPSYTEVKGPKLSYRLVITCSLILDFLWLASH